MARIAQNRGWNEVKAMCIADFVKVRSASRQSNIGPHVCVKYLRRYASLGCVILGASNNGGWDRLSSVDGWVVCCSAWKFRSNTWAPYVLEREPLGL